MGYIINYSDIYKLINRINEYKNSIDEGLSVNHESIKEISHSDLITGDYASAIKSFVNEVYEKCNEAISQALFELQVRLVFYMYGWYSIDAAGGAILNIDKIEEYKGKNFSSAMKMYGSIDDLNNIIRDVKDIIDLEDFSYDKYKANIDDIESRTTNLISDIISYEDTSSNSFESIASLLTSAESVIKYYMNKSLKTYNSGDAAKFIPNYNKMIEAYSFSKKYTDDNAEKYFEIKKEFEKIINKYHSEEGFVQYVKEYSLGKAITHMFSEDPVDLSTGNYVYQKKDISVEADKSLEFVRFYNGLLSDRNSSIGKGFTHNYEKELRVSEDIFYEIKMSDGHKIIFVKNDKGVFDNMFSDEETLNIIDDGTDYRYVIKDKDEYALYFGESGEIIREEDKNGRGIFYYYNNDINEKVLCKVQNDYGDYLEFCYNEEGYISYITSSTDRTVRYEYKDGYLVNVYLSNSSRYHYTYSSNGQIVEILNADVVSFVKNEYDDFGRILRQEFVDGSFMEYSYNDNAVTLKDRNGSITTYEHDELNRTTRIIYPDRSFEEFKYNDKNQVVWNKNRNGFATRYGYTSDGRILSKTDALGTTTAFEYSNNNIIAVSIDGNKKMQFEYDCNNNITNIKYPNDAKKTFQYDDKGHVISYVDEDGLSIKIDYDARGNVIAIKKSSGLIYRYKYDKYNRPIKLIDGNDNEYIFEYDSDDRITRVVNPYGDDVVYEYNVFGEITSVKDFDNNTVCMYYNDMNLVDRIVDKEGNETKYEYDNMWNRCKTILPSGAIISNEYDKNNRLKKVVLPEGQKCTVEYDSNGNIIKETDGSGATTKYVYDVLNRLICVVDALGHQTRYKYNSYNQIVAEIDNDGNENKFEYDETGMLISETNRLGHKTIYEYYPSGKKHKAVFDDGSYEEFIYEKSLLVGVRSRNGVKKEFAYDKNENVIAETNSLGETIEYKYDKLNRLVEILYPTGGTNKFEYDSVGNMTKKVDGNGNSTLYEYTKNGHLQRVIDANGNITDYIYDCVGNLSQIVRCGGEEQVTKYDYNLNGDIVKVTDPLGNSDVYTYDGAGRVISKLDRDDNLLTIKYNMLGQIQTINYDDNEEINYVYNSLGFLKEIKNEKGVHEIKTDVFGRILTSRDVNGQEYSFEWIFDNKKSVKYPDGSRINYEYNNKGQLESIWRDDIDNKLVEYKYDDMSRPVIKKMKNGQKTQYSYNKLGKVESIVHYMNDLSEEYFYEYDLAGNKTTIMKSRNLKEDCGKFRYNYDVLNQLIKVSQDGNALREYDYDSFGNRIRIKNNGIDEECRYNKNNQLIYQSVADEIKTYAYDKRGNVKKIHNNGMPILEFNYSMNNRLSEVLCFADSQLERINYSYNGFGQRIGQTSYNLDGTCETLDYVVDITKRYNNLLSETGLNLHVDYIYDGMPVGYKRGENTCYYYMDDLGSVLGEVDSKGRICNQYGYDECGSLIGEKAISDSIQSLSYAGYRKEKVDNLFYANARIYDSRISRFLSEDIIKGDLLYPISINSYVYCYNSPMSYVDLDGRQAGPVSLVGMEAEQYIRARVSMAKNGADDYLDSNTIKGTSTLCGAFFHLNNNVSNVCRFIDTMKSGNDTLRLGLSINNFFRTGSVEKISTPFDEIDDLVKFYANSSKGANNMLKVSKVGGALAYVGMGADVISGIEENLNKDACEEEIVMDALVDVFFDLPAVLPIPGVNQVWSSVLVIDSYRGNPWRNATKDFIYEDCYPGMKATSVRNSNDPNFKFEMPSYGVVHP